MNKNILIIGDILAMAVVTLIGFATHGEMGLSFLPRMSASFFPLLIGWFLLAFPLRLFDSTITSNPRQLWLPALTMIFAAPFAAVLRGLILNAPIIPIFPIVLGVTSALGMTVWRGVWIWINRSRVESHPPS